jgi:single-strand DNA-binding protein
MPGYNINRVVLVGRLTQAPRVRSLPDGTSVCGLRIACNSTRRDPDGGAPIERPHFFDVSVFGAAAENVSRFLERGRRVGIDGRLEWREWETAEQGRRQAVSIVADTVQFLDAPGEREPADALELDGELATVGAGSAEEELDS